MAAKTSVAKTAPPKSVDAYLAALPQDARDTLEVLRRSIKNVLPEAVEVISYQIPTFKYKGRPLVYLAAWKNHCSLYPITQAVQKACADELKAYETSKGTIRFPIGQPLPPALVKKIVKARIDENQSAGTGYAKTLKRKG
jgi:uncharacterized protein YdhG (YjbR/CyaY superfamily)